MEQPEQSCCVDGLAGGVREWLARHTSRATDWSAEELAAARDGATVSVVIPARNEEATVGAIVTTIRRHLVEQVPLVDEVLVVDSWSTDRTAAVAAAAGARVVAQHGVPHDMQRRGGKGDALWKGLASSLGELVVFVDGDLRGFTPDFVTGLLGPLLTNPSVAFVKAFYRRPFEHPAATMPDGGGRVTELVARPLLNLYWPVLAGFVQPLAGEYAGRRQVLEKVPFVTGYGVELGLLVDLLDLVGLDAMAQVDLGYRQHTHQDLDALGRMGAQIMLTAVDRLQRQGRLVVSEPPASTIAQFHRSGGGTDPQLIVSDVAVPERPPLDALGATPAVRPGTVGP